MFARLTEVHPRCQQLNLSLQDHGAAACVSIFAQAEDEKIKVWVRPNISFDDMEPELFDRWADLFKIASGFARRKPYGVVSTEIIQAYLEFWNRIDNIAAKLPTGNPA